MKKQKRTKIRGIGAQSLGEAVRKRKVTTSKVTVEQLSEAVRKYIQDTGGPDRRPLDSRVLGKVINR